METKRDNPRKSKIPEEVKISSPEVQTVRLLGSHSSRVPLIALRPKRQDGDEPPPPPPPAVSVPDLAIQFSPCLEDIPVPSGFELKAAVLSAVQEAFGADTDPRYLCLAGKGTIGIWLRPFVSSSDSDARDRGLRAINILQPADNFAFFQNAAVFRRFALDYWNSMTTKQLDGYGNPDPNGPIHLTSLSVDFQSPSSVLTIIDGFDERPWPDVNFKLTITDSLSANGGLIAGDIHCESKRDLDADTGWLDFLTGLFSIAFPPLGAFFLVEDIFVRTADAPSIDAGIGCAAKLIPEEILIPGGQKIVVYYTRVNVSSSGVFAGGTAEVTPRSPQVSINTIPLLSADVGSSFITASYALNLKDFLKPLQINWTADGEVLSPGSATTNIRFNISGAKAGRVLTRLVSVRVTDRDSLSAVASIVAHIHIVDSDSDIPVVCRKKPWLPQCQETLARAESSQLEEQP